ncbi:dynein light chain Tctex-type protein 2B isoform X2 [Poeciliopsis prolifica]|uniref:dynein light chain Tctex-type protein 2B isoform X2 n=1 Tax=Poeciliopsis prolifica TaxID=188132 RepID=UPI0024139F70|nr:dynein light chain Tctex-type protein 2B isoform X2 [Poeciliopsis prolifica]
MVEESDTYHIRPNHRLKFKPAIVKGYIRNIIREHLSDVQYDPETAAELTRSLAESVKDKVKTAEFDRYKIVVQVLIGEQRGQGVKMCARCLWDADTDNYAEDVFMNDSLFCVVTVFGSYYY